MQSMDYTREEGDEVEDLVAVLEEVKVRLERSERQRARVERATDLASDSEPKPQQRL